MSYKFPTTLGACVDLSYAIREERLEVERQVKEMKAREEALETHIFNLFKKSDLDGAKGKTTVCAITLSEVPQIKDYDAFMKYIFKTKAIDLLERRASVSGCRARWENGVEIPGVEKFERLGLSITKLGDKKKE